MDVLCTCRQNTFGDNEKNKQKKKDIPSCIRIPCVSGSRRKGKSRRQEFGSA